MNENLIDFWQVIATTSFGIVVTLIGFWVTVGKNMATKNDVLSMIETQSPYS